MTSFKLVLGAKDGKSYQKEVDGDAAETILKKTIGDTVLGEEIGFPGYEFQITGGSDKCGFPMRKGIQIHRKQVMIGKSVGFSGRSRDKKEQRGLLRRRTVCGEKITRIIHQINLKILKEGPQSLGSAPVEEKVPAAKEQ